IAPTNELLEQVRELGLLGVGAASPLASKRRLGEGRVVEHLVEERAYFLLALRRGLFEQVEEDRLPGLDRIRRGAGHRRAHADEREHEPRKNRREEVHHPAFHVPDLLVCEAQQATGGRLPLLRVIRFEGKRSALAEEAAVGFRSTGVIP